MWVPLILQKEIEILAKFMTKINYTLLKYVENVMMSWKHEKSIKDDVWKCTVSILKYATVVLINIV